MSTAAAIAARYDASEQRDWRGRWARGNWAAGKAAEAYATSMRGKIAVRYLSPEDVPAYERETLDPIRERYTDAQQAAINEYVDNSGQINNLARGKGYVRGPLTEVQAGAAADEISAAMTPLPDDLMLLREIGGGRLDNLSVGDVFSDDGFASTTLRPGRFAGGRPGKTVMHILAPKGTPFVWAGRLEDELTLDRGQAFAIMGKPEVRRGVTHINVLALPKGTRL